MTPSEFNIPLSVESYDEKTTQKLQKLLRYRKAHSFQATNDIYLPIHLLGRSIDFPI